MLSGLSALLATVAGKVALGTGVAVAVAGGAHALDVVELPGMAEPEAVVLAVEVPEEEAPEDQQDDGAGQDGAQQDGAEQDDAEQDGGEQDDGAEQDGGEVDEDVDDGVGGDEDGADDDGAGEDGADEEARNHGAAVSAFAAETELEGCERGQAIAELASSKAAERRNNPERDHDPCGGDDEDADDEEEADEEVADDDAENEAEDEAGDDVEDDEGEEDADEPRNHGAVVSAFAAETELEGCEKGQAIAELASSKAAERRNNPERDHDPCAGDEDPADEGADDEPADEDAADDGADGDPAEEEAENPVFALFEQGNGNGNGNGNGQQPDWVPPGQSGNTGRPDHAGGNGNRGQGRNGG